MTCSTVQLESQPVSAAQDQVSPSTETQKTKQTPYNSEQEYASYLRGLYTSMSHNHTPQHWTHLPRCEFIQLAMIGSRELRRGDREEEMVRLAQQGRIETIMSRKEPIDLNNIFSTMQPLVVLPPPPHTRVLLIEGAPGGGKSTLALHICHQWAQDAFSLGRFDLVVLAYLRDQAIQNATTLADVLTARNFEMSQTVASQIQDCDGQNILFIFDGWDEFPSHLQKESIVSTVIWQPHKLSLHQSTVLITSRPVSSGNLLHIADRRVEILGFTQNQILEYIEKCLGGNSAHIQKLVQHLEEHPVIEGYCYVPLHVAILVHVFLTMKGALPTTLHELFGNLVLCCIARELETHESKIDLSKVLSLNDLPNDLKSKLNDLCILAYEGVMKNQVVFYDKDLHDFNLPSNLPSLGLLQAVEGLTLLSKSFSYNFLHLSVQELLAAYYISRMDSSKQLAVFEQMFGGSRFQAVLHYYSGFTQLANPKVQDFISAHSQQQINFSDLLPLLHCFYEAQEPSLCKLIKFQFKESGLIYLNFELNPADYLAIGYYITSILSMASSDAPSIRVKIENTNMHGLKLLLFELAKYPRRNLTAVSLTRRLEMELNLTSAVTDEGAKLIVAHIKQSPVIDNLTVDFHYDCLEEIFTALQSYIKRILFSGFFRNYDVKHNGSAFSEMLQVNKSITHLTLSQTTLFDLEIHSFFQGLQHNSTITHLSLNLMQGSFRSVSHQLTTMLQENKTLKSLDLSNNNNYCSTVCCCIFQSLQHNNSIVHLNLSNMQLTPATDFIETLGTMLQVNRTLTHLNLSENCYLFFTQEPFYIFQCLQHNTSLVNLNLSNTGLVATDDSTAQAFTTMLQFNKALTHLDLSKNKMVQAYCIFKGLQDNTTLEHLNVMHTTLTPTKTTAQLLIKKIQDTEILLSNPDPTKFFRWALSNSEVESIYQPNSAVVHLNLSNTGLIALDDTAQALISMLLGYTKLTYLDISGNYLSDLGDCGVYQCVELNTTLLHFKICGGSGLFQTNEDIHTAPALTKMLQVNKTLTHLELSAKWGLKNACCIFQGLQFNDTIVHLDLSDVSLAGTAQALDAMLRVNKTLKHLNLSQSRAPFEAEDCVDTQGFHHNTTLVYLNLINTGISDEGAKNIAQALINSNCSLQTLDISHNHITDADFACIEEALKTNTSLMTLNISHNLCSMTMLTFSKKQASLAD